MYLSEASPQPARAVPPRAAPAPVLGPVRDVTRTPFRWVCRIVAKTPKAHSVGTGILIGPWHVLTAAHVIYPLQEPYQTLGISISPGYSAASKLVYASDGWSVSPAWNARDCNTDGSDWGVVRLNRPVPSSIGYWTLASFSPATLSGKACMVAGYPSRGEDPEATQMFQSNGNLLGSVSVTACTRRIVGNKIVATATGNLVPVTPTSLLIAHSAPSEGSMSGGPVWLEGQTPLLVAMHVGVVADGRFKKAVLLTEALQRSVRDLVSGSLRPLRRP